MRNILFVMLIVLTFKSNANNTDLTKLINEAKNGSTITLSKGEYHFWGSKKMALNMSNSTPIDSVNLAILFENKSDIKLDCSGSTFIFHGKVQPFSIINSNNITIKNVNIDWEIPFTAESEIIDVNDEWFDIRIDNSKFPFIVKKDKLYFMGENWEAMWGGEKWNDPIQFDRESLEVTAETHDNLIGSSWPDKYKAVQLKNNTVRILYNRNDKLVKGNFIIMRHSVRDHCGIFADRSNSISLENINMHSNSGISFLMQYCGDITMNNVNCIPSPNRNIISGHDDGLHFSNCKGVININNCTLQGLMDDAINVHGSYVVVEKITNRKEIICRFPHYQSSGLIWAEKFDSIRFSRGDNLLPIGESTVTNYTMISREQFRIILNDPAPDSLKEGDCIQNLTWEPSVNITNCYIGQNRARGILVSTGKKTIIENNSFNTSGSAILVLGDAKHYYETAPANNLLIRNNQFLGSCLTSDYLDCEAIITITVGRKEDNCDLEPLHKNINITNNKFNMFDYPMIYAKGVDELIIEDNIVTRNSKHKPWHIRKEYITTEGCKNVVINNNSIEPLCKSSQNMNDLTIIK